MAIKSKKSVKKAAPKAAKKKTAKKAVKKANSKAPTKKVDINANAKKSLANQGAEKIYVVFKNTNGVLEYLGRNKETFRDYLDEHYGDLGLNFWDAGSINDSIEAGDADESHPIAIEIFDNENRWVYCYPEASRVLYTQKEFENGKELSVDMGSSTVVYFKEDTSMDIKEKQLIK